LPLKSKSVKLIIAIKPQFFEKYWPQNGAKRI